MDMRPEIFDLIVFSRRMNPIGQEHNVAIFLQIPPYRAAGETEMSD
jgi:hypothetical protein